MKDTLLTKDREELVRIADNLNIKPHHKALPETIVNQIMAQPMAHIEAAITGIKTPTGIDPMAHPSQKPIGPAKLHTPGEVLEAVKSFTVKDGYKVQFLDNDNCWHFSYKGAEESGHMSVPLRVIRQKAESVARGKRQLMSLGRDNTFPGSYTDSILTF